MMELDVYKAFVNAGASEADARTAAESIHAEIDKRYALHSQALVTRSDLSDLRAELKADIGGTETRILRAINEYQRWTIGLFLAAIATVSAVIKLL